MEFWLWTGENHEVAQVSPRGRTEPVEDVVRRAHHAQIDILGRSSPLDAKLDSEASLEGDGVAELKGDAREETIEHDQLASPGEVEA